MKIVGSEAFIGRRLKNISDFYEEKIIKLINDLFSQKQYTKILDKKLINPLIEIYSNQEFWLKNYKRELVPGNYIILRNFLISEWVPLTPGLYFTKEAYESRLLAFKYEASRKNELRPIGKGFMKDGGIGCLRLKQIEISSKKTIICCASSNGIFHEGIPIVVSEEFFNDVIELCKTDISIQLDIYGYIQQIPDYSLIDQYYATRIPRYCLVLDGIDVINEVGTERIVTLSAGYRNGRGNYWTFKTAVLNKDESRIEQGADWIFDYITRYSKPNFKLLNDFDAQVKWFEDVEYPLDKIQSDNLKENVIQRIQQGVFFTDNSQNIWGDNNTTLGNISDSNINID